MNKRTIFAALFAAATMGLSAQKPMTAPAGGKAISDELIGIFFEDINNSADGGLYAELVQNGSRISIIRQMAVSMPNWYRTAPSSSHPLSATDGALVLPGA